MTDLDALLRGAAIGIALLTGIAFWRARPNTQPGWIALLYAAGMAGYLLWGDPASLTWPLAARVVLAILALSPPFFFWAFAHLIFEDDFRLRAPHWIWLLLIEAAGVALLILRSSPQRWLLGLLWLGFRLIALGLLAQALWVIWRGWRADLVASRARLRIVLALGVGVGTMLILLSAAVYGSSPRRPPQVQAGEAAIILAMSLGAGVLLVTAERDLAPAASGNRVPDRAPTPGSRAPQPEAATGDPQEDKALARLTVLMQREEAWRESGLAIGKLAERVGIPEYRLRRLINQRLGFRNFTAFLNDYRLAAASRRLADPGDARTPILTIALELGWGSIGPFNRAFRARFGQAPSDYRRERLAAASSRAGRSADL
jgi:AraC-like DNA-binding protein